MPELATRTIAADGRTPSRWLAALHGILGRGRNWASVANALVAARPDWGVLLVDLREHGDSQGFPPPHDVGSATDDVARLLARGGAGAIRAVLGHSFGGKVALALAGRRPVGLEQAWIVDASPSAGVRESESLRVLELLRAMPAAFATRDEAVTALESQGLATPIARWLASSLRPAGAGYRFPWDLDAVGALLSSYFETEVWDALESEAGPEIEFLVASHDSALSAEDIARLRRLAAARARLHVETLDGGHWLHVDRPAEVVRLLAERLPR